MGMVSSDTSHSLVPEHFNDSCMTHQLTISFALVASLAASIASMSGCETEQSYADKKRAEWSVQRPDAVMVIRHHVGGTHHRTLVRGDLWYATYSNTLIVMSASTGTVLASVEIMPFGTCGGIKEVVAPEGSDQIYLLLDGTAVCEVSLAFPRSPVVTAIRRYTEIGFARRAPSPLRQINCGLPETEALSRGRT